MYLRDYLFTPVINRTQSTLKYYLYSFKLNLSKFKYFTFTALCPNNLFLATNIVSTRCVLGRQR